MRTLSSDKNFLNGSLSAAGRAAYDGILTALAMILSYIEAVIPSFLPLPGFKPGFANIVVLYAIFFISARDAAFISICRVALSSLFFGTAVSFAFSASGAAMSFAAVLAVSFFLNRGARLSWIGISVLSAAAHNSGQLAAAYFIMGKSVISYFPWLIIAAVISGIVTGLILCILSARLKKLNKKN